jgi:hypothetical protein
VEPTEPENENSNHSHPIGNRGVKGGWVKKSVGRFRFALPLSRDEKEKPKPTNTIEALHPASGLQSHSAVSSAEGGARNWSR